MKKCLKRAGALLLAVMLLCGMLAMPAGAVSNTFTEGEYISWIVASEGAEVLDCWVDTSLLPPGTSLTATYDTIVLSGTPETPGTYEFFVDAYYSTPDGDINRGYSVTVTIAAVPAPTPVQAASGTNTSDPEPEPTSRPEATATPNVSITKHPTGETVEPGDSAIFIARADHDSQIIWHAVKPDGTVYDVTAAPDYTSSSLSVSGQGTETLTLSNIPLSMNGWSVECEFVGANGSRAVSNRAKVTVNEVVATAKPTNTPSPTPTAEPEPTEEPAPAEEIRPTEEARPTSEPKPTEIPVVVAANDKGGKGGGEDKGGKGGTAAATEEKSGGMDFRIIAAIALGVIGVGLVVVLVIMLIRRKSPAGASRASASDSPYSFRCDKCGWKPADPNSIPRFCPNCGDVFDEKDVTMAGQDRN